LDLKPVGRDKKGEATDSIFAAMKGVVRHVSNRPGGSNYGRYVVLEHPEESPPVYTLYAHLAEVAAGVTVGRGVEAGAVLGVMGRSTSGEAIPRERAHLHFEIGVRITDGFAEWYRERGFGSSNTQGLWNGMNLAGIDPLEVFSRSRDGGLGELDDVFAAMPSAVTVRVAKATVPDFVKRYPSLVQGAVGVNGGWAGWEIGFAVSGAPIRWRRLTSEELAGFSRGEVRVVAVDLAILRENPARRLARSVEGGYGPGADVETILEQLF
jgi:murein DD-endopeptidase MepM/ murein hydrolase activator NlpD